jgi:hypothetical protein
MTIAPPFPPMQAVASPWPAWGVDCDTVLAATIAAGLRAAGAAFALRYLGSLTPGELQAILETGMLVGVVTYADEWEGASTVADLRALGVPAGVTVWLDVEGLGPGVTADEATAKINAWSETVVAAGYLAGLYVGDSQPLDAAQLYAMAPTAYWRSASLVVEPECGYQLVQSPTTTLAGVSVDVDYVMPDRRGRLPAFVGLPPSAVPTAPELPDSGPGAS